MIITRLREGFYRAYPTKQIAEEAAVELRKRWRSEMYRTANVVVMYVKSLNPGYSWAVYIYRRHHKAV